jgi:hypothetical protein
MHNGYRKIAPRYTETSPREQPHHEGIHRISNSKRTDCRGKKIALPLRIIQSNDRIAEVQFICDYCGKPTKTSLIPTLEVDVQKGKPIFCWHCKQAKVNKKSTNGA